MKKGKGEGRTSSLNINKRGINMKKTLIVLLTAVLVMSMLFVSCSNEAKIDSSPVEVSFNAAQGRGLTSSIETHEVEDLYWYYKATRTNGSSGDKFNYGVKTNWTFLGKGLANKITLSQGKWDFSLQARRTQSSSGIVIYEGSVSGVLVLRNENTPVNQISVPVSQLTSGTGTILISKDIKVNKTTSTTIDTYTPTHVKYKSINTDIWSEDIPLSTETVEGVTSLSDTSLDDLVAGAYDVVVMYKGSETVDGNDVDIVFASAEITVTVYGNTTTTISGSINGITTSNQFTTQISGLASTTDISEADKSNAVPVSVPLTPQGEIGTETNVTFDAGTLPSNASNVNIEVKTVEEAQTGNFIGVDNNNAVVAAIDLKITDNSGNELSVNSGDGKKVTVTTYILKNLSNVVVKYNGVGEQPGSITVTTSESTEEHNSDYYESDTGKLVFTTTHFSEFYVESDIACYILNKNTGFKNLGEAFSSSTYSDNIYLQKDIILNEGNGSDVVDGFNVLYKTVNGNIYGNGHTIKLPNDVSFAGNFKGSMHDINYTLSGKSTIAVNTSSTVSFDNVDISGNMKCSNNMGAYIVFASSTSINFKNCEMNATIIGDGGKTNYNAVFVGYPMSRISLVKINIENCSFNGSLTCGTPALFVGNDAQANNGCKITVTGFSFGDNSLLKKVNVSGDPYPFNGVLGVNSKKGNTFIYNGVTYEGKESINNGISNETKCPMWGDPSKYSYGPADATLSISQNEDNTFIITAATNTNAKKYVVKTTLYTQYREGGTLLQSAQEIIDATFFEDNTYTTKLKNLKFVDKEWTEANTGAELGSIGDNTTYKLGDQVYYLIPDTNNGYLNNHSPAPATIISVTVYDKDGNTICSASL